MDHFIICNKPEIQGVPRNLLESGEQFIVVSRFSSVFFWVSDKRRNKCSKDSFIQILELM